MLKKYMKLIIGLISVMIIAVILIVVLITGNKKLEIDISELDFGFDWETDMSQVEKIMLEKGYEKIDTAVENVLFFVIRDFQGIEGADGRVFFSFNRDTKKLEDISYAFRAEGVKGLKDIGGKMVVDLKEGFDEAFKNNFDKSVSGTLIGVEWSDYSMYYLGEEAVIYISYNDDKKLMVTYTDKKVMPDVVEILEDIGAK